MDFLFMQFFVKKKYDNSLEEYFNIGRQSVSDWRISGNIPDKRLLQFQINNMCDS